MSVYTENFFKKILIVPFYQRMIIRQKFLKFFTTKKNSLLSDYPIFKEPSTYIRSGFVKSYDIFWQNL